MAVVVCYEEKTSPRLLKAAQPRPRPSAWEILPENLLVRESAIFYYLGQTQVLIYPYLIDRARG